VFSALLVLHEQRLFVLLCNNPPERSATMATCPECGGTITATSVERGEILPCPDCGAELEVREIDPLVLELAPEVREDWGE
jgi:alpha-aminoadipate carrier protein LysW